MCSYFSPCCEKESPEDLIQPGCSSAVQLDPAVAEGGLIAWGESHHFLGKRREESSCKVSVGLPSEQLPPGCPGHGPMALPPLPPGRKMGVPRTWAAPAWGRTAAAGSWHLSFCPPGTWR